MRQARHPTVHLLAGLPGAGKTTVAKRLVEERRAVRFTLDEWMLRLYGLPFDDPRYGDLAMQCRELIWDTAQQVLSAGVDVVLDWSQWSRERRAEWSERAASSGWPVTLHHVTTPPDVAVRRVLDRTDPHCHRIDDEGVHHMARLFEEPTEEEGIPLVRH